jgi:poly-gamma-glutamate synthesis protein (capsule biosynthesis protein)
MVKLFSIFRIRLFSCLFLILIVYFFSSCEHREFIVIIQEDNNFRDEIIWLEETLSSSQEFGELGIRLGGISIVNTQDKPSAKKNIIEIHIGFFSSWEFEDRLDGILVSKKWLLPQGHSLVDRRDTSLELCLNKQDILVTLEKIIPPFTALRVDGYSVGDDRYPLIRIAKLRLNFDENNKYCAEKAASLEKLLLELHKPLVNEKPVITWISSAGDMMLGRNSGNILLDEGPGALLGGVADIISQSDLAMVNLEGPLSNRGKPERKSFTFRFEPPRELAIAIKNMGIDAVLFANNHTFDFGEEAFLDTLYYLEEAGVAFLGVGRYENEALSPFVFEKDGFKANVWGLASFPTEMTGWNGFGYVTEQDKAGFIHVGKFGTDKLKQRLREHKNEESLNVVLFHGGVEWSRSPSTATRELYTSLASEGADLIIGSHPHIVQGFEWVDGKLIFWSLGNFVFSGMENTDGGDEGLLIRLGYWGKKPLYIEPFAINLLGPRVELASNKNLENFYRKSRELAEE